MKILLFGKSGQVGWELNRSLLPLGNVVALGRQEADLSEPESLRNIVRRIRPDVVVNAAAYTNVEKAELDRDLAYLVNAVAPGVLAEECQRLGAIMLHYSTDYVFDGTAHKPYVEDDAPNPLNVYGRTKLDGEVNVREQCLKHLIVRCGWVYASRGSNFLRSTMELLKKQDTLHIVDDQFGAPTCARYIADASACIIRSAMSPGKINSTKLFGTYHLSSGGICSWYEFSKNIIALLEKNRVSSQIEAQPISSDEYKSATRRPSYSVLDCNKVSRVFAVRQVDWQDALELCFAEICHGKRQISPYFSYHCVELVIPYDACDAAMELHGKRFLSAEAPTLPLPGCGQTCGCRFKHHNDRRHEERRDPFSTSALHSVYAENKNRRLGGDRRRSVTNDPRLY